MPIAQAQAVAAARVDDLRAQFAAKVADWSGLVTLEIGCGHGHFMAAYAAAHPDERCLAIDIIRDRLERAQRKTDRAGLTNVAFLRAEARMLIENLPESMRLRRVFVLFPIHGPSAGITRTGCCRPIFWRRWPAAVHPVPGSTSARTTSPTLWKSRP